jgi:hypothetical protein
MSPATSARNEPRLKRGNIRFCFSLLYSVSLSRESGHAVCRAVAVSWQPGPFDVIGVTRQSGESPRRPGHAQQDPQPAEDARPTLRRTTSRNTPPARPVRYLSVDPATPRPTALQGATRWLFSARQNDVVLLSTVAGLVSGGAGHSVDGCSSPVPVT